MIARNGRRRGFSLMEMVIATAVLAGSGGALFALLGQATQLARKAEQRTVALQLAQSTLDEFLANGSKTDEESEGSFDSDPRWSYRLEQSSVDSTGQQDSRLKKVVVSVYRSSDSGGPSLDTSNLAIVRLVRWMRITKPSSPPTPDSSQESLQNASSPTAS